MTLSRDQVAHVAMLARLGLSDEEMERYREQLDVILAANSEDAGVKRDEPEVVTSSQGEQMRVRYLLMPEEPRYIAIDHRYVVD